MDTSYVVHVAILWIMIVGLIWAMWVSCKKQELEEIEHQQEMCKIRRGDYE